MQAVMDGTAIGFAEPEPIARDLAERRIVRLFDVRVDVAPNVAYRVVYPERMREDPRVVALRGWRAGEIVSMPA
ncbi:hypothetical protein [Burkholderia stagnalis]